jgi:hypothetical protein
MCITTVAGVLVVHEGARRLRWAHERDGCPAPLTIHDWQIAGLWPDEGTRTAIRARIDRGEPVLVIIGNEPPTAEFPAEFVPRIPDGVELADVDQDAGMVTLRWSALDWLHPAERTRGLAFADEARKTLDRMPRFLRPPLILEERALDSAQPLVFVHAARNNGTTRPILAEVVRYVVDGLAAADHRAKVSPSVRRTASAKL